MKIKQVIFYLRENWEYMKGVKRDKKRVNRTGEVFTPNWLVDEMLDQMPDDTFKKIYLDTSCGDGQILAGVVIKKMQLGMTIEEAIDTIRGTDIEPSNVKLARRRLSCGQRHLYKKLYRNIKVENTLNLDKNLFESD